MEVRARASDGEGVEVEERLGEAQLLTLALCVTLGEGEEDCDAEVHPETLPQLEALGLPLLEPVVLGHSLGNAEGEGLPEGLLVGLALRRSEPVTLVEELRDLVTVQLREPVALLLELFVALVLCVSDASAVNEGEWLADALTDAQSVPLGLREALTLPEALPLLLSLPLTEGDALGLAEPEGLRAALGEAAPDLVLVVERVKLAEGDWVRKLLAVFEAVIDPDKVTVPQRVTLGLLVNDAQPLPLGEAEALRDPLGLSLALPLPEGLPEDAMVPLTSADGDAVPVLLVLGLPVAAPSEAVLSTLKVTDEVPEPVPHLVGLCEAELVPQALRERVAQPVPVTERERDAHPVFDRVTLALPVTLISPLLEGAPEALLLPETEGVRLLEEEALIGALGEGEALGAPLALRVTFADAEAERAALPVRVTVGDCDLLTVPHRLTVGLRVTEGHTLSEGVPEVRAVALTLLEELLLAHLLAEPEANGDVEGAAEGVVDWLGEPEPEGLL